MYVKSAWHGHVIPYATDACSIVVRIQIVHIDVFDLKVVQFQDKVKIVAWGLHKHFILGIVSGTAIRGSITASGIVRVALSSTLADLMLTGKAERRRQTERVIEKASASEYQMNFEGLWESTALVWCSEGTRSAAAQQKGSGKFFMTGGESKNPS